MKTTKYNSLVNLLSEKQTVSGIRKHDVRDSLNEILSNGRTTTGFSCKGKKSVWTSEVSSILSRLGINHECGNDAPRGGASGEYVQVTSPSFMAVVNIKIAERKTAEEAYRAEIEAKHNTFKNDVIAALETITEDIRNEYRSEINSRIDGTLTGDRRRRNRKSARKAASNIVGDKYGIKPYALDYIMTTPNSVIEFNIK